MSDNNKNTRDPVTPGVTNTITSKPRGFDFPNSNREITEPDQSQIFVKNHNSRKSLWSLVPNLANASIRNFISLIVLLVFAATLGIFGYRQFSQDVRLTSAYPSTPVTPNRQLSFQGRLELASGTPIEDPTNITFKLWNHLTNNTEVACDGGGDEDCLYTTSTCLIDPDPDGVFSTQIGSSCGASIPATLFTENSNVWLEVTVLSETLSPRQPIASVAYALNSETIQGFPISATVSAIRNTVVPMNQWGEIIVGEQSPRLTGVSGTFAISAPAISITTATGTNGNITLAPDGTGQVNIQGNTTSTNFFNVSNAQLTTGSLITGTAANNNTGFKLIDLLSGSSPTSKFSVTDAGNTTIAGDLTITGGNITSAITFDSILTSTDVFTANNTLDANGIVTLGDGGDAITLDGSALTLQTTGAGSDITINAVDQIILTDFNTCSALETSGGVLTCGTDSGGIWNTIGDPGGDLTLTMAAYNTIFNWDPGANNAETNFSLTTQGEDLTGGGDEDQVLLALSQTSNGTDVDEAADALLTLTNNDSNDPVNSAIRFDAGAAGTDFTYGLNFDLADIGTAEIVLENGETIDNQIDGTINLGTTILQLTGGTSLVSDQSSVSLFDSTTTSLTIGSALTTLNLADSATTKTIDLGGVTNSGTDTVNIATNATAADTIAIGNNHVSTLLSLTGGDDWNLANTGILTLSASSAQTTALDITDSSYTNSLSIADNNLTGTTANIDLSNFDVVGSTGSITTAGTLTLPNSNTLTGVASYTQFSNGISVGGGTTYYLNNLGTLNANAGTFAGTLQANGTLDANGQVDLGDGGDVVTINGSSVSIQTTGAGSDITLDAVDQIILTDFTGGGSGCSALSTDGSGFLTCDVDNDSAAIWSDGGTYLYPTATEVLGNSISGGANKLAGIYLADSAPLAFGNDNDISFSFSGSTLGSTLTNGTRIGIGTTAGLATLDVRGSLGTIPTASISGNTSQATLVVDQSGIGDIFTASKSGATHFVITNAGNVGIGVAAPTNKLEIGGTTSTISNSSGDLTIDSFSGSIVFGTDDDLLPTLGAGSADLGSVALPWDNLYVNGLDANGTITLGDDGDTLVIDTSDWDIDATGAMTNMSFDANGTGNSISNIESADIADATIAEADLKVVDTASDEECLTYETTTGDFEWQTCATIPADSLDFTEFSDTMSLDASTSIAFDATEVLTLDAATVDTTTTGGVLDFHVDAGNAAVIGSNLEFTQSAGAGIGVDAIAQRINLSANDTDGDVFGLVINALATANAAAGSYEAGIKIDNAENIAASMTDAIIITATSDTAITTGLNVSDAEIVNAISIGTNLIEGTNFDVDTNGHITVQGGYGLDTGAAGILNLGDTTATTLNLGTTAATTLNLGAGGALTRAINLGTGTGADTINIGTGLTTADDINIGGLATSHLDITGITNFAGGTTYYVDSSGNAKFLDLQVADTGNPGLSIGDGTTGYLKVGGSTISDAAGNLTLDSDTAAVTITDDLAISGGNITTATTFDSNLTITGTLDANGDVQISDTNIAFDGATTTFTTTGAFTLTPGGAILLGDNGDTMQINSNDWDIATNGDMTGIGAITADGTITTSGDLAVNGDDITSDGFLTLNAATYVRIGDTTTPSTAGDDNDDLFVEGDIELDGDLILDGGNITTAFTADSTVTVTGTLTANGALDANGSFTLGDNGDTGVIDTSDWNIDVSGNMSGIGTITSDGAITTTVNDATNNNITNVLTLAHTTSGTPTAASSNFNPDQTNSLGNDLVAYWDMDEVSGTRVDSASSNDLADGSSVGSAAGKLGNGADFELASTDYIWTSANQQLNIESHSFTIATWIKIESYSGSGAIATMWNGTNAQSSYYLYTDAADSKVKFYSITGTGTGGQSVFSSATVSTGAWHFVVADYNRESHSLNLQIDNGTIATTALTNIPIETATNAFVIGSHNGGGNYYDGMIDEMGVWKRTLTTQERTDLYNGTTGNTCTDDCNDPTTTTPGIGTGILMTSEDASGNAENQARISSIFNNATSGTETSSLLFETRSAGAALARNMRLDGAGNITARGNIFGGGLPDIAENIRVTDTETEAGDIVMIDHNYHNPDSSDIYNQAAVKRADMPYGDDLIGVISSNPGLLLNSSGGSLDGGSVSRDDERPLVLAGRVPVKVSTINGSIALGDRLTASTTPGVGMKATRAGRVIGQALEPLVCPAPSGAEGVVGCSGTILVMVEAGWYEPQTDLATAILSLGTQILDRIGSFGTLIANSIKGRTLEIATISPLVTGEPIAITGPVIIHSPQGSASSDNAAPLLIVDGQLDAATISARVAILGDIQAQNITAKNIVADTISANHIEGLDAKIASLSGNISDSDLTSITDRIKARLAELTGNVPTATDIPIPQEAIAAETPSETISDLSELGPTATSSASIDFATINNYLAVIGSATITTLDVTNGLYTDSLDSKSGSIALAGGTLIVNSAGTVAINGDLTVTGKIIASELDLGVLNILNEDGQSVATIDASGSANLASLTTSMITIAAPAVASQSALASLLGNAQSNATAGEAWLVSPSTELTIESPYVTPNSLVYLTPTTNTDNKVLFVKSKSETSFTVAIDAPASSDISFNWWIIQLASPKPGESL